MILSVPGDLLPIPMVLNFISSIDNVVFHEIDSDFPDSHVERSWAALNLVTRMSRRVSAHSSGSDVHFSSETFKGGGS